MRGGKELRPFPHTPFLACASLPPLRSGQVLLDEAEHLLHNRSASVATLRELFAFGPECRSRSLRNHRSPSPLSSLLWAIQEKLHDLGHFYTLYDDIEHLKRQFRDQLDKLLEQYL